MARPAKLVETQTRHNTKADIEKRKRTQDNLKGDISNIKPPYPLSKEQKKIFNKIKNMFAKTELIGELDCYVLAEGAVVIDRLQQLEQMINGDPGLLIDKDVMSIRKGYTQDFFRICNELSLSPQARAKVGSIAATKDKEENDPLLKLLN